MTKKEYIEKVSLLVSGGDLTADLKSRYHPILIGSLISEVYSSFIKYNFSVNTNGMKKNYSYLDNFTKPFKIEQVHFDNDRKEFYIELPKQPLINETMAAIRFLSKLGSQEQFSPIANGSGFIFDNLEVGEISSIPRFYLENKIVYIKFPLGKIEKLLIKLVVSFNDLDDDDSFEEPSIMGKNGPVYIHDEVKRRLLQMPPTKQTEDNTTLQ